MVRLLNVGVGDGSSSTADFTFYPAAAGASLSLSQICKLAPFTPESPCMHLSWGASMHAASVKHANNPQKQYAAVRDASSSCRLEHHVS